MGLPNQYKKYLYWYHMERVVLQIEQATSAFKNNFHPGKGKSHTTTPSQKQ